MRRADIERQLAQWQEDGAIALVRTNDGELRIRFVESSSEGDMPFPCIQGKVYVVTEHQRSVWSTTYPAVDVVQELRKARAWLEANPRNMKTIQGMPRFLTTWLSRTQDRAPAQRQQTAARRSFVPEWERRGFRSEAQYNAHEREAYRRQMEEYARLNPKVASTIDETLKTLRLR